MKKWEETGKFFGRPEEQLKLTLRRVRVWGIRGAPPPPTTKLAIFYRDGYQSEILVNATGYATTEKWDLYERMMRFGLKRRGILDKFDVLEFQRQDYFSLSVASAKTIN